MTARKRSSIIYPPPLHFDASKYRHHIDDLPLSDKEKDEVIRAVWDMLTAFVDAAWSDEPKPSAQTPSKAHESAPPASGKVGA